MTGFITPWIPAHQNTAFVHKQVLTGGGRWEDQDSHDDLDLGPVWIRAYEEILIPGHLT
jgi:hypothetical protein